MSNTSRITSTLVEYLLPEIEILPVDGPDGTEVRLAADFLGASVVTRLDGTWLGRVQDVLFDLETNRAMALVLEDKNWLDLMGMRVVPWSEIMHCSDGVVTVAGAEAKMPLRDDRWACEAVGNFWAFSATDVRAETGELVGHLCDVYVHQRSGAVAGFRTSEGFQTGTLRNKDFVPTLDSGRNRPQ